MVQAKDRIACVAKVGVIGDKEQTIHDWQQHLPRSRTVWFSW